MHRFHVGTRRTIAERMRSRRIAGDCAANGRARFRRIRRIEQFGLAQFSQQRPALFRPIGQIREHACLQGLLQIAQAYSRFATDEKFAAFIFAKAEHMVHPLQTQNKPPVRNGGGRDACPRTGNRHAPAIFRGFTQCDRNFFSVLRQGDAIRIAFLAGFVAEIFPP